MAVRLSTLCSSGVPFSPKEDSSFCCRLRRRQNCSAAGRARQTEKSSSLAGIEPATFWFVALAPQQTQAQELPAIAHVVTVVI
jgi:hypothetical protein